MAQNHLSSSSEFGAAQQDNRRRLREGNLTLAQPNDGFRRSALARSQSSLRRRRRASGELRELKLIDLLTLGALFELRRVPNAERS